MKLKPYSTIDYAEYCNSIKKYNLWFIKLRYFAAFSLLAMMLLILFLFDENLQSIQVIVISISSIIILLYNLFFQNSIKKYENSNDSRIFLKFSFAQILLDLILLAILTYITGGIESPFFFFFIFHMIIGSLILPISIIYSIATALIILFSSFSILELFNVIPHFAILDFYKYPIYSDVSFVISRLLFFSFSIIISIYLTSKIAQELYARERELKTAIDLLNEAEESKQKYIMAVVHELKSPIAAASSFLDLIIGGFVGEVSDSVKEKIGKARARTGESTENINSILRVSKFKLLNHLDKKDIDILPLIDDLLDGLTPQIEKKEQKLELINNGLKELFLFADEVLIKLVLSNLIGNAVKYTPKKGKIKINLNKDLFEISDSGIGIPKDELEKIFNEFYRASNTKDKKIEGTGTGLNVVKQIVESHEWQIKVESPSELRNKQNFGTTFTIKFGILKN